MLFRRLTTWSVLSLLLAFDAARAADEMSVAINITIFNNPPVIVSGPAANPNPAVVNQDIQFSAAATDPEGDVVSYAWDFGDGTTGTGSSPKHSYQQAGAFRVTVKASDPLGGETTGTITINITGGSGGGGGGGGTPPPPPLPWTIQKAQLAINFKSGGTGKFTVAGLVDLPAGWDPNGKSITLNVGGFLVPMTLNAKGIAAAGKSKVKITRKLTKKVFLGGPTKIGWTVTGPLADDLKDEGFVDADAKNLSLAVSVGFNLAGQEYLSPINMLWSAKKGATGKAKK